MPRKNPFPEREAAICQRLREFRLATGFSQVVFSRRVGLDSTKLAAYEHARVPLKYGVANRIAQEFNICQRWLATGKLPIDYYVEIAGGEVSGLKDNSLFSEAYDDILASWIDRHIANLADSLGCKEEAVTSEKARLANAGPLESLRSRELTRNAILTIARLQKGRGGTSAKFIPRLNDLFDRLSPTGTAFENEGDNVVSLAGGLFELIYEYCEAMTDERSRNFLKQVITYSRNLYTAYNRTEPVLALANSRGPDLPYRVVLLQLLELPNTATDEEILTALPPEVRHLHSEDQQTRKP